jgi:hypothetical protein
VIQDTVHGNFRLTLPDDSVPDNVIGLIQLRGEGGVEPGVLLVAAASSWVKPEAQGLVAARHTGRDRGRGSQQTANSCQ